MLAFHYHLSFFPSHPKQEITMFGLAGALLASMLITIPPDSVYRAADSVAVTDSVSWLLAKNHELKGPGAAALIVAFTEAEFDAMSNDSRDSLRVNRSPTIDERQRIAKLYADSLGCDVSVITLKLRNYKTSQVPARLLVSWQYGIRRDGQLIPAFGLASDVYVEAGVFSFGFVVFPKMEFRDDDLFVIKVTTVRPVNNN